MDVLAASLRSVCTYAGRRPLEPPLLDATRSLKNITLLRKDRKLRYLNAKEKGYGKTPIAS